MWRPLQRHKMWHLKKNIFLSSATDERDTDGTHVNSLHVPKSKHTEECAAAAFCSDPDLIPSLHKLFTVHEALQSVRTWWRTTCRWHRRPLCSISLLLQQCQTSQACRKSYSGPETADLCTQTHTHTPFFFSYFLIWNKIGHIWYRVLVLSLQHF